MVITLALASTFFGQSSDQNFPTPITKSTIDASIKARDLGDARSTTYYYAFSGEQGDIFMNVSTKNFDGVIDVFATDGMRPLTKMVIFSEIGVSETGRLIYLRKPERLLLRVQGRSPDDNLATVRVKFGGNFVALNSDAADAVDAPIVTSDATADVLVNSVGTIIPTTKTERITKNQVEFPSKIDMTAERTALEKASKDARPDRSDRPSKRSETTGAVVADKVEKAKETAKKPKPKKAPLKETPLKVAKEPRPPVIDPLANIRLVIALKNGKSIERPLPEILRFSVDKGVLTVIANDGSIRRFQIIDVIKVTIE